MAKMICQLKAEPVVDGEGVDIDLYADDFGPDDFSLGFGEGGDLYDTVIAESMSGSGGGRKSGEMEGGSLLGSGPGGGALVTTPTSSSKGAAAGKKYQLVIGNLTWWTSDKDIQTTLEAIGVRDFVDVKFYENRANGQSKGYCMVTVGSGESISIINEHLPMNELHGRIPVVAPPTKQALNQFESLVKTRPQPPPQNNGNGNMNWNLNGQGGQLGPGMCSRMDFGGPRMMMRPMGRGPLGPPPRYMGGPQHGSPRNYNPMMRHHIGPHPPGPPPGMMMQHSPQPLPPGGPMHLPMMARSQPASPREWSQPPSNDYPSPHGPGPLPPLGMIPPPPSGPLMCGGPPPPQLMISGPPPPAPHMNPAFFNSPPESGSQGGRTSPSGFGRSRSHSGKHSPSRKNRDRDTTTLSEAEFEEVMCRNRAVSSSAISRAVADTASGEYASAIETLVTAISLIKSSKAANGDRCKVLICSLQDTLFGIEAKSYGGRERERSTSRERGHRRFRADRSGSWEKDYRDRMYVDYNNRGRSRSRSPVERDYRDREHRESSSRCRHYEERERLRDREPRERVRERTRSETEISRDRERARESSERSEIRRATRH